MLGPWWITISTFFFVLGLGYLWSGIFGVKISTYFAYFVVGHVVWGFISLMISDSINGFTQFDHIIKQVRIPISSYLMRLLVRNLIIFAHNLIIVAVILIYYMEEVHVKGGMLVGVIALQQLRLLPQRWHGLNEYIVPVTLWQIGACFSATFTYLVYARGRAVLFSWLGMGIQTTGILVLLVPNQFGMSGPQHFWLLSAVYTSLSLLLNLAMVKVPARSLTH